MSSKSIPSFPRLPERLDRSLIRSQPSKHSSESSEQAFKLALREFEEQNPDYAADVELSAVRSTEFSRLKSSGTVYVDYMGGSLYPESLVSRHLELLKTGVFGNTHSDSPTYAIFCRGLDLTLILLCLSRPGQRSPTPTSRLPVPQCSAFLMRLRMNTSASLQTTRLGRSSSWVKHTLSPIDPPMSCQPIVITVSMAFGDSRIRLGQRCSIWTP